MRRLFAFLVGPVFLMTGAFVVITVLLSFVVSDLKTGQPAIVHLKAGVAGGGIRDGEVTKSDKYVIVKSPSNGKEIFGWEQIEYISEKDPSTSKKLDQVVDLIDLLSKFGLVATVVFFMVGLSQYSRTQKWEREKFLTAEVKEFIDRKTNRGAMHMIDSLALYKTGRMVELFPETEEAKDRKVFITNDEIYAALTTNPHDNLDEKDIRAIAIRDCFDSFLSYMGTFHHYVQQGLITRDALSAHIGYWFELLGPKGSLAPAYKKRIFAYATKYGLTDFEKLVKRYSKPSFWERMMSGFPE
jgi:hypothetical protein